MHCQNLSTALDVMLEREYENSSQKLRQCLRDENSTVPTDNNTTVDDRTMRTWHHQGFKFFRVLVL